MPENVIASAKSFILHHPKPLGHYDIQSLPDDLGWVCALSEKYIFIIFRPWDFGIACHHSITYPILTDTISLELENSSSGNIIEKLLGKYWVTECSAAHWEGS